MAESPDKTKRDSFAFIRRTVEGDLLAWIQGRLIKRTITPKVAKCLRCGNTTSICDPPYKNYRPRRCIFCRSNSFLILEEDRLTIYKPGGPDRDLFGNPMTIIEIERPTESQIAALLKPPSGRPWRWIRK